MNLRWLMIIWLLCTFRHKKKNTRALFVFWVLGVVFFYTDSINIETGNGHSLMPAINNRFSWNLNFQLLSVVSVYSFFSTYSSYFFIFLEFFWFFFLLLFHRFIWNISIFMVKRIWLLLLFLLVASQIRMTIDIIRE